MCFRQSVGIDAGWVRMLEVRSAGTVRHFFISDDITTKMDRHHDREMYNYRLFQLAYCSGADYLTLSITNPKGELGFRFRRTAENPDITHEQLLAEWSAYYPLFK